VTVWARTALAMLLALAAPMANAQSSAKAGDLTFDGLQRVKSKRFEGVWIKPGADFAGYTKMVVLPAEISFKRDPKTGPGVRDNFALNSSQMSRLRKALRSSFQDQLVEKGGWEIVEEPSPDALLVRGGLIDLVVHIPPPTGGRSTTYVRSFGEATLVIELYDSESRQILARIADRDAAEPAGQSLAADIQAGSEVRRMFNSWAKRFRAGLDEVRGQ
jgi:hypothetical protein